MIEFYFLSDWAFRKSRYFIAFFSTKGLKKDKCTVLENILNRL